jgi:hypothetical protein
VRLTTRTAAAVAAAGLAATLSCGPAPAPVAPAPAPAPAGPAPAAPASHVQLGLGHAATAATMQLALVDDGDLLLARTDRDLGGGPPIGVVARYSANPTHSRREVERDLAGATLPPPIAGAIGLEVELLDPGLRPLCRARIGAPTRLRARGPIDGAFPDSAAADAALWASAPHVVIAPLLGADAGCRGRAAFARPAALPPLATGRTPAGIRPPPDTAVYATADGSTVFYARVTLEPDSCDHTAAHTAEVWRARRVGGRLREDPWSVRIDEAPLISAAVDVDGDGRPDLVATTGVFPGDLPARFDDWVPRLEPDLPPGYECDGTP